MNHEQYGRNHHRKGMALPLVLICIVIAMTIGAALTQTILLHYRHAQLAEHQCQSLWLAESAVQRAVHKLRNSPQYQGEVWNIPAGTLSGKEPGRVTIQVERRDGAWKVRVEAVFPDHPQYRVVAQRELVVPISARGGAGG
jgi:type II secretory pathway component PulK